MRGGLNEFDAELLGKPDVDCGLCSVCGAPASNMHHVIEKGLGGVPREVERLIPKVRLCGSGTTGCHGRVHARLEHIYWSDGKGGWVRYGTARPMDDFTCWDAHSEDYEPLPGWVMQQMGVSWSG